MNDFTTDPMSYLLETPQQVIAPIRDELHRTNRSSLNTKKASPPRRSPKDFEKCLVLRPRDKIYTYGDWDSSPVVLRDHKTLFFTTPKVGCTVWKQLFRRMMGYEDWQTDRHPLPHAPTRNGLIYLYDIPPQEADQILTDPNWTRALFVREPKVRLLSAYLDKGTQNGYMQFHCCPPERIDAGVTTQRNLLYEKLQCDKQQLHHSPLVAQSEKAKTTPFVSFEEFLKLVIPFCKDKHWELQSERVDKKYWKYINFVGHMETMSRDAEKLLKRIGAWDDYGSYGWNPSNGSIFEGVVSVKHATDSSNKLSLYLTPEVEELLDQLIQPELIQSVLELSL